MTGYPDLVDRGSARTPQVLGRAEAEGGVVGSPELGLPHRWRRHLATKQSQQQFQRKSCDPRDRRILSDKPDRRRQFRDKSFSDVHSTPPRRVARTAPKRDSSSRNHGYQYALASDHTPTMSGRPLPLPKFPLYLISHQTSESWLNGLGIGRLPTQSTVEGRLKSCGGRQWTILHKSNS